MSFLMKTILYIEQKPKINNLSLQIAHDDKCANGSHQQKSDFFRKWSESFYFMNVVKMHECLSFAMKGISNLTSKI